MTKTNAAVRHIVLVAPPGASMDTLQAVMEFEDYEVTRVVGASELDNVLTQYSPQDSRLVVDDSHAAGTDFFSTIHRHPRWLEVPIVYLSDPGRPVPPDPGVTLKKPVTAPTLAKTLRGLAEFGPAPRASETGRPVDSSRFGGYELLAKIASGGMGTVYLAQRRNQVGFHRLHALKVMHPHLTEDPEVSASFLDEAAVASRVHHANVAAIVDLGVEQGRPFIVMEYIEGCSLSTLLRAKRGPAPATLVGSVLVDVLDGLHAAHTLIDDDGAPMGIVHRDVSPENILVGVDGVARIADFGIAKARNRVSTTGEGIRKGKLLYLSPEQLQDRGLDPRVDVYAAGVVLWNALTGRRLFSADAPAQVLSNIATAKVIPPSQLEDSIPDALDAVCLRALARDRDERFSSATEMAQALRRAMVGLGVSVAPQDVGAWVRSVCGDELETRRAMARQRRRSAGLPTTSLTPVSGAALLEGTAAFEQTEPGRDDGQTLLAVSESGSTNTGNGWSSEAPAPPPVPGSPATTRWVPLVLVGVLSVTTGGLLVGRCSDSDTREDSMQVREGRIGEAEHEREEAGPTPTQRTPAAPANSGPPPEPSEPPVAEVADEPTNSETPKPEPPDAPADAAEPTEDIPHRRAGKRRRRPVPKRPTPVEPSPEPQPDTPATQPSAPEPKPEASPPTPDPLRTGPDRNPYKAP